MDITLYVFVNVLSSLVEFFTYIHVNKSTNIDIHKRKYYTSTRAYFAHVMGG